MTDFKKLLIWQRSHNLVLEVYSISKKFPKDEIYGLTSQIRRCAVSVPSNIAEGSGKNTDAELARYLVIAMGSFSELEYQMILARDLDFINIVEFEKMNNEINESKKMLNVFISKIKTRIKY
jgi:four helix bundle protein